MNEIIAYTIGSFWLCPDCHDQSEEQGEPTTADQLMSCYRYACDVCGKLIRKRLTRDG